MERRPTNERAAAQPRSNNGRRQRIAALIVGAAVVCALAATFIWLTLPTVAGVTPANATKDDSPTVVLSIRNADDLRPSDLRATVNDRRIPTSDITASNGIVRIQLDGLADGQHRVAVKTEPVGLLQRQIKRSWSFRVDTVAPRVAVTKPNGRPILAQERRVPFAIATEPDAEVTISAGPVTRTVTADSAGEVAARIPLKDGRHEVVITARDDVGNVTRREMIAYVDATKPTISFTPPQVLKTRTIRLTAQASDNAPLKVTATLQGYPDELGVVALDAPAPTPTATDRPIALSKPISESDDAMATDEDAEWTTATRWQLRRDEPIAEGVHRLRVVAEDRYGNKAEQTVTFLVDSTEQFGGNMLARGARGADVRGLHDKLIELGHLRKDGPVAREYRNRIYGRQTTAAVRAYQNAEGLDADGIVGDETLSVMTVRIVINRATHTLTLYRADEAVKTYTVAVGSPRYPTPSGTFEIVNKQKDPTWTPPDSDWAKDAKPIPPGPDNPLGTRWMGLDSPNVGIHGTNSPASLGYSVSHGCIRMAISDVEDLFEQVKVGTPVTIV